MNSEYKCPECKGEHISMMSNGDVFCALTKCLECGLAYRTYYKLVYHHTELIPEDEYSPQTEEEEKEYWERESHKCD